MYKYILKYNLSVFDSEENEENIQEAQYRRVRLYHNPFESTYDSTAKPQPALEFTSSISQNVKFAFPRAMNMGKRHDHDEGSSIWHRMGIPLFTFRALWRLRQTIGLAVPTGLARVAANCPSSSMIWDTPFQRLVPVLEFLRWIWMCADFLIFLCMAAEPKLKDFRRWNRKECRKTLGEIEGSQDDNFDFHISSSALLRNANRGFWHLVGMNAKKRRETLSCWF